MCRLLAYLGHDVLLEDVIVKPVNSIVMQSMHARESSIPTNGDGFGLGWYVPSISPKPALFKSILPAWNDHNLLHLTSKLKAPCFFAHVRAASNGEVSHNNCHPFTYKKWMLMHNGEIQNFVKIKRQVRRLLSDEVYNWIKGDTDSEHLFALALQHIAKEKNPSLDDIADALEASFTTISELNPTGSKQEASYYNVCITDGKRLIATRYCTHPRDIPESMHYSVGSRFVRKQRRYHMLQEGTRNAFLVSSEMLNDFNAEWCEVPPNHFLLVDENLNPQLRPIKKSVKKQ